jgi:hypothetical protein
MSYRIWYDKQVRKEPFMTESEGKMPRSFDKLVAQAKQVFQNQPIHVDKVCDESGPMSTYLAVWTVVEAMSYHEVLSASFDAAKSNRPFPSKTGRFNESDWVNLLTDALVACMEAELNQDNNIRTEARRRMQA